MKTLSCKRIPTQRILALSILAACIAASVLRSPLARASILHCLYDGAGRLVGVQYDATTNTTYHYDSSGSLSHVSSFTSDSASTDLAISQSVSSDSPIVGIPFVITLTAANLSATSAANVRLSDSLPTDLTSVFATASRGDCSFDGTTLNCSFGTLGPGQTATVTLRIRPATAGPITHTATLLSDTDPITANNISNNTLNVQNPPALVLQVGVDGESQVKIIWPAIAGGLILEETGSLTAPVIWTLAEPPSLVGGTLQTSVSFTTKNKFYRLRIP